MRKLEIYKRLAACTGHVSGCLLGVAVLVATVLPVAWSHEGPKQHGRGVEPLPPASHHILPTEKPIVVGMSMPLTGPTKQLGQEMVRGVYSYIRQINAAGGVHGRKLKLVVLDDGYEPMQTVINTRRLLDHEKAFALLGYVGTPTSQVAVPIAQRAGVPFVAPFTGAAFLREVPKHNHGVVFNIRPSYHDETRAMVEYLVEKKGVKRIGLLVQNDAYGNDGRTGVQESLAKYGLEVAAVAKYQRNTSDIAPAVNKLQQANPEAVIVIGTYAPTAAFVRKAHAQGFKPQVLVVSFVGGQSLAKELGQEGEGIILTQTVPSPQNKTHPLVQAYTSHAPVFDPVPTHVTLEGYLAAAVLVRMLEETGPQLSRAAFFKTIENIGSVEILGQTMTFSETNHNGTSKVYFTQLKEGDVVPFQP